MSLPQTSSNFKGKCKKCKVEYEQGTTIYKINEEYWCSNPKCPGSDTVTVSGPYIPPPTSIDLEAKLDQIWDIAVSKATKIINETYDKEHMPSDSTKQILIMAQTFTKALCGCND